MTSLRPSCQSGPLKEFGRDLIRVSDYVVRFIADQGVKHVFLVTGGGAMHLNDSLSRCSDIEPVCNSHEQASAIGAETVRQDNKQSGRGARHNRAWWHELGDRCRWRLAGFVAVPFRLGTGEAL